MIGTPFQAEDNAEILPERKVTIVTMEVLELMNKYILIPIIHLLKGNTVIKGSKINLSWSVQSNKD